MRRSFGLVHEPGTGSRPNETTGPFNPPGGGRQVSHERLEGETRASLDCLGRLLHSNVRIESKANAKPASP
jgi:hypothetical protein